MVISDRRRPLVYLHITSSSPDSLYSSVVNDTSFHCLLYLLFVKRTDADNLSRQMMDMVVLGKRRRMRPQLRWTANNRKDMTKYELTADMTENRQYWKMMVKLAHEEVEMVSKGEKGEKNCCNRNFADKHYIISSLDFVWRLALV